MNIFNNKKIILATGLAIFLLVIVLIITINTNKENTSNNPESTNSEIVNNELSLINKNQNTSKNKLAFIFDEDSIISPKLYPNLVLTIDYDNILSNELEWDKNALSNDVLSVSAYDKEYLDLSIKIDEIPLFFEYDYVGISDLKNVIANNDRWILEKNNETSYTAYYQFNYNNNYPTFDSAASLKIYMFDISSDAEAKELYNKYMDIISIYFAEDSNNFINVKDLSGNNINLSDYTFFNDIVAKILKDYNLNLSSSTYIAKYESNNNLIIHIPNLQGYDDADGNNNYFKYTIEHEHTNLNKNIESTFMLNNSNIKLITSYSNHSKIFHWETKDGYMSILLELPYDITDTSLEHFKNLFTETFK